MELTELEALAAGGEIDTVITGFTDLYGRNMGKRFDARYFIDHAVGHGTHGCDYLLTVDMEMEPVPGYRFANWELGYGDFHLVPDLSTLRRAAWAPSSAIVLCDVAVEDTHDLVEVAPRTILRRQLDAARELGYRPLAASELEFFLYADSYRHSHETHYAQLRPAGWYGEDYHLLQGARVEPYVGAARRALAASGIGVETSKGETGLGQHELNIRHAGVLEMADRHTLVKQAMKEIAEVQQVSVTFMAKPHADQAGSSCHLHFSLTDAETGANRFADTGTTDGRSDVFRWFLGGWMHRLVELMVFYAPTVNSYKRFEDGSWAPTRIAWADDNRTASFRVVGTGPSLRIECRVPGADVNPYLAYAAALASGLDGIANRTEPPPMHRGDVYTATDLPRIPPSLAAAVETFAGSDFARANFGDDVVDHYARFYTVEAEAYRSAVTDWERARYFERI